MNHKHEACKVRGFVWYRLLFFGFSCKHSGITDQIIPDIAWRWDIDYDQCLSVRCELTSAASVQAPGLFKQRFWVLLGGRRDEAAFEIDSRFRSGDLDLQIFRSGVASDLDQFPGAGSISPTFRRLAFCNSICKLRPLSREIASLLDWGLELLSASHMIAFVEAKSMPLAIIALSAERVTANRCGIASWTMRSGALSVEQKFRPRRNRQGFASPSERMTVP